MLTSNSHWIMSESCVPSSIVIVDILDRVVTDVGYDATVHLCFGMDGCCPVSHINPGAVVAMSFVGEAASVLGDSIVDGVSL